MPQSLHCIPLGSRISFIDDLDANVSALTNPHIEIPTPGEKRMIALYSSPNNTVDEIYVQILGFLNHKWSYVCISNIGSY